MFESMTFSFAPNKSDYYKTLRSYYVHLPSTPYILIFLLFVSVFSLYLLFSSTMFNLFGAIFPAVFIFYLLMIFFFRPAEWGSRVEKSERLRVGVTWEVGDERICIKNQFSDSSFDWGTFGGVYETGEHFIITYVTNRNMYQIVPKRAFPSEQEVARFRGILEQKIAPIRRIRSVNLPEWPVSTVRWLLLGLFLLLIVFLVIFSLLSSVTYYF